MGRAPQREKWYDGFEFFESVLAMLLDMYVICRLVLVHTFACTFR
jgi:hypothetical protein